MTEPSIEASSDSNWTYVIPKSRPGKRRQNQAAKTPLTAPTQPRVVVSSALSASGIRKEYAQHNESWKSCACYNRLKHQVLQNIGPCQPILNAICLGIGSFDPEDGSWDAKRRAYIQLCAFLTIVDHLGNDILCQL
jgi:hypothetical protein